MAQGTYSHLRILHAPWSGPNGMTRCQILDNTSWVVRNLTRSAMLFFLQTLIARSDCCMTAWRSVFVHPHYHTLCSADTLENAWNRILLFTRHTCSIDCHFSVSLVVHTLYLITCECHKIYLYLFLFLLELPVSKSHQIFLEECTYPNPSGYGKLGIGFEMLKSTFFLWRLMAVRMNVPLRDETPWHQHLIQSNDFITNWLCG